MKVITKPSVRLKGRMVFIADGPDLRDEPRFDLPPHGNDAENLIAFGGKVCYDSYGVDGRPVPEHIKSLNDSGHGSVLEHAHFSLYIGGISRGCSHEIVRHRMFNYSQRSTRYTAEDDAAIVLDPYYADIYERLNSGEPLSTTAAERVLIGTFIEACSNAIMEYQSTVGVLGGFSEDARVQQGIPTNPRDYRKWCRGKARQLLPHAIETRMVMTGNIRAWKHFLVMRTSRHAEAEIRRLADHIWRVLWPLAPNAFGNLTEVGRPGGYVELVEAKP